MSVVQGASSSANGCARACEARRRREDEARVLGTSTAVYAASDSSERSTARTASNSDSSDRSTASTAKTQLSVGRRQRSIIHPHKGFGGF